MWTAPASGGSIPENCRHRERASGPPRNPTPAG
jgi:hypothetical protein